MEDKYTVDTRVKFFLFVFFLQYFMYFTIQYVRDVLARWYLQYIYNVRSVRSCSQKTFFCAYSPPAPGSVYAFFLCSEFRERGIGKGGEKSCAT